MAEHKSKAVFDDEVRAFLEDVSAASLPEQIPKADILAQAPAYNIATTKPCRRIILKKSILSFPMSSARFLSSLTGRMLLSAMIKSNI